MAELLIVVAILVVLMGVIFVGVQSYQRSSTRLEYDGIAKEIFIAAQNHLTAAQGQGYLQMDGNTNTWTKQLGSPDTSSAKKVGDERYFLYNAVDTYASNPLESESLLDLMLPFGAIDETVRAGGTYVIRYQPSSGRVLDVFYSLPGRSGMLTVNGLRLEAGHYNNLMDNCRGDDTEHRRARENFNSGVVGWYGGEEGLPTGEHLADPEIEVHNEETLWVEVTDNNSGKGSLKLIITGVTSGAQSSFDLRTTGGRLESGSGTGKINVILDDITRSGFHFAELLADDTTKHFIPGENVIIEAVAYNNEALTNIAYSGKKTTNSLYEDLEEKTKDSTVTHTAMIANFRHLENLDANISRLDDYDTNNKLDVVSAEQTVNISWTDFKSKVNSRNVVPLVGTAAADGCYLPVTPSHYNSAAVTPYALGYDGKNHKVSEVKANIDGPAGLFGTLIAGSEIKNLELVDFEITATGTNNNAGALVGTATGTEDKKITITNVLAHNSAAGYTANVTASGGDAGGLIGSATNCTVNKSAAALTVNGSGSAGGLIGSASATTVSASYSGGHTFSGDPDYSKLPAGVTAPSPARTPYPARYYNDKNEPIYNVTGGTTAGGLIGSMTGGSATNCYSTCSATGTTAGGFVGTATGSISNSYCTGLVHATGTESITTTDGKTKTIPTDGAFAYSVGAVSNCQYFEIINERWETDNSGKKVPGYYYLTALGKNAGGSITKLDQSWSTYQAFSGAPADWKDAHPYDSGLTRNYQNKYNLETVAQLGAEVDAKSDFVAAHYGDWPAPEEFIFN